MSGIFLLPLMVTQAMVFQAPVPNRLAMTPSIDGKLSVEEWDHLSDSFGMTSYFQWEPGALFGAFEAPKDAAVRWRFDFKGDGFDKGNDNLELLIRKGVSGPEVTVSQAVGDQLISGLAKELIMKFMTVSVVDQGDRWTGEFKLNQFGQINIGNNDLIGVRVDPVFSNQVRIEGGLQTVPLRLALDRSFGLPSGVKWQPEFPLRSVVPGETIKLRMNFNKEEAWNPTRIEMRTVGKVGEFTPATSIPFPPFDKKSRSISDYIANVTPGAPTGWTVLLVRITDADGQNSVIQSSYQITESVKINQGAMKIETMPDGTWRIKGEVVLRSQTRNSIKAKVYYSVPEGWAITKGNDAKAMIYHSRGSLIMPFELRGVTGMTGLLPITVKLQIGERIQLETFNLSLPVPRM